MIPPIKNFSFTKNITQMFGVNAFLYKNRFNIPAHNALDIVVRDSKRGFGTPILAAHDGIVEKIIYDVPHKTKGNGIYLMTLDGKYTTIYWHIASFEAVVGQKVKQGQIIGTMGNSGFVFPRPSSSCIHCGTHVHFGIRDNTITNDYRNFIDPTPFLFNKGDKLPIRFSRNMFIGSRGDDVSWLQTILKIEGFAQDYEPIGYFGLKTRRDVALLQKKYGITPALGYCWTKTRRFLMSKYYGHL